MTTTSATLPAAPTDLPNDPCHPDHADVRETLKRVWAGLLRHFLTLLEGDEPIKASMLNVIRQFLHENGVHADGLMRAGAADQARRLLNGGTTVADWNLPTFDVEG